MAGLEDVAADAAVADSCLHVIGVAQKTNRLALPLRDIVPLNALQAIRADLILAIRNMHQLHKHAVPLGKDIPRVAGGAVALGIVVLAQGVD